MIAETFKRGFRLVSISLIAFLVVACDQGEPVYEHNIHVSTFAGTAKSAGHLDGMGAAARFNEPHGIDIDTDGNFYVAEESGVIRKITPDGVVTTLAGVAGQKGHVDGMGTAARFTNPLGIVVSAEGIIYVSDNHTIRKITPAGDVTTLAGMPGMSGGVDGTGSEARFHINPDIAIGVDGNLYAADFATLGIRKITPTGVVTTLKLPSTGFSGIDVDKDGTIYVTSLADNSISKVTPEGNLIKLAGAELEEGDTDRSKTFGSRDATGTDARFSAPTDIVVDDNFNVFVVDFSNSTIRKVTPQGRVTTVAGKPAEKGFANGIGKDARFDRPGNITMDANGLIYVAETGNHTIRKVGPAYHIGGTVNGLKGSLVLSNLNNGENIRLTELDTSNPYRFPTVLYSGSEYNVIVLSDPEGQSCTVTNGSGTMVAFHIMNIHVSCTTDANTTSTIGGTVSGLSGSVVLQNNGGDDLTVTANGSFTFATPVNTNDMYSVSVLTQPSGQTCSVSNNAGTAASNVTNVAVNCENNTYTISGTVSGLSGTVVLQNNGADNLNVSADGSFTFATPVNENSSYSVSVFSQPSGQTCTVSNGNGTATANVTNVTVSCTNDPVTYSIGGMVNGLNSVGLQLQNQTEILEVFPGAPDEPVPFEFMNRVNSGDSYNVTISAQPATETCTVTSGGSGTATSNVSDVVVDCVAAP